MTADQVAWLRVSAAIISAGLGLRTARARAPIPPGRLFPHPKAAGIPARPSVRTIPNKSNSATPAANRHPPMIDTSTFRPSPDDLGWRPVPRPPGRGGETRPSTRLRFAGLHQVRRKPPPETHRIFPALETTA